MWLFDEGIVSRMAVNLAIAAPRTPDARFPSGIRLV